MYSLCSSHSHFPRINYVRTIPISWMHMAECCGMRPCLVDIHWLMDGVANETIKDEVTNSLDQTRLLWSSPFTALSIISNWESKFHREGKGFAPFYDVVTTVGYYRGGRFEVPGIVLRFRYNPGTMMGLCGKALEHGAAAVDGDRFCVVQYCHRKVLDIVQRLDAGSGFHRYLMSPRKLDQTTNI